MNQTRERNEVVVGKEEVNEDIVIVRVTDTATGIADETRMVIGDIVVVDTTIPTVIVIETETEIGTEMTRIVIAGANEMTSDRKSVV